MSLSTEDLVKDAAEKYGFNLEFKAKKIFQESQIVRHIKGVRKCTIRNYCTQDGKSYFVFWKNQSSLTPLMLNSAFLKIAKELSHGVP